MRSRPNVSVALRRFCEDPSGAVTVDWVMLTAAAVGLAIVVSGAVTTGVTGIASDIGGDAVSTINGTGRATYTD